MRRKCINMQTYLREAHRRYSSHQQNGTPEIHGIASTCLCFENVHVDILMVYNMACINSFCVLVGALDIDRCTTDEIYMYNSIHIHSCIFGCT
jgi:hypothetical protein